MVVGNIYEGLSWLGEIVIQEDVKMLEGMLVLMFWRMLECVLVPIGLLERCVYCERCV